ncbi:MAG: hypothetical protein ACK6DA_09430 [Candidatus Kapaibacterium sp.]|jgi:hypothetical protein
MYKVKILNPLKFKKIINKAILISKTLDEVRFFYKNEFYLSVLPDGYILDVKDKTFSISKNLDYYIAYNGSKEDFQHFINIVRKEYAPRKLA